MFYGPIGHKFREATELSHSLTAYPSPGRASHLCKSSNCSFFFFKELRLGHICASELCHNSLRPHGCPWDFPGENTGVGCTSYCRGSSPPRDRTHVCCLSCISRRILYCCATQEPNWGSTSHKITQKPFGCQNIPKPFEVSGEETKFSSTSWITAGQKAFGHYFGQDSQGGK